MFGTLDEAWPFASSAQDDKAYDDDLFNEIFAEEPEDEEDNLSMQYATEGQKYVTEGQKYVTEGQKTEAVKPKEQNTVSDASTSLTTKSFKVSSSSHYLTSKNGVEVETWEVKNREDGTTDIPKFPTFCY